jgi:chaperonin GroES
VEVHVLKLRPLGDRVLVQLLEAEQKTKSGIVLPESAQEKSNQAKVIAVGPGKIGDDNERIKPEVKVGDTVLFSEYAGQKVKVEDDEYQIVRLDDILAVFE